MIAKRRSIAEARSTLPRLIREAEEGATVELTRRGVGVAVLMGRRQYERMVGGKRTFAAAWDEFRRTVDLDELDIDPDEVFAGARDRSPGRDESK